MVKVAWEKAEGQRVVHGLHWGKQFITEATCRRRYPGSNVGDDWRYWAALSLSAVRDNKLVTTDAKGFASWQAARAWVNRRAQELVEKYGAEK